MFMMYIQYVTHLILINYSMYSLALILQPIQLIYQTNTGPDIVLVLSILFYKCVKLARLIGCTAFDVINKKGYGNKAFSPPLKLISLFILL